MAGMLQAHAELIGLWEERLKNQELLMFLQGGDDRMMAMMSLIALEVSNVASGLAPWLTGTLASAHRGHSFYEGTLAVAEVYIDPTVVNPVFGGYPAVYGAEVHQSQPWMDWTVMQVQEQVFSQIDTGISFTVKGIFA